MIVNKTNMPMTNKPNQSQNPKETKFSTTLAL